MPVEDNELSLTDNSLIADVKDSLNIGCAPISTLQSVENSLKYEKETCTLSEGDVSDLLNRSYKKDIDDQLSSTRMQIYLAKTFATLRTFRTYSISWGNCWSDI
jgi:hypothetical protein